MFKFILSIAFLGLLSEFVWADHLGQHGPNISKRAQDNGQHPPISDSIQKGAQDVLEKHGFNPSDIVISWPESTIPYLTWPVRRISEFWDGTDSISVYEIHFKDGYLQYNCYIDWKSKKASIRDCKITDTRMLGYYGFASGRKNLGMDNPKKSRRELVEEGTKKLLALKGITPKKLVINSPEMVPAYIAEGTIRTAALFSKSANDAEGSIYEVYFDEERDTYTIRHNCLGTVQPKIDEFSLYMCTGGILGPMR